MIDELEGDATYAWVEKLHESAQTMLCRAKRRRDSLPVVLKILCSDCPTPKDVARLRHEHWIVKDLDADCVVRMLGVEEVGGHLALVMEDFGGRPLDEILRYGGHRVEELVAIGIQIALALGTIHDQHITHKDIKPANILFNRATGQVKLCDFGIATRLLQEAQRLARPDVIEGTLAYMSPEQTGRMNRLLDSRTDLYSLGITLYEMLTGTLPFQCETQMEMVQSHIARLPVPPREVQPSIPEPLSDIVLKLLEKDADDRYQSGYGVAADLRTCLEQSTQHGRIERFPLGRKDPPLSLRLAQKLYGREPEREALFAAFERVKKGSSECLLVRGAAGIGKSALVGEVRRAMARSHGYLIMGKFDQRNRNTPGQCIAEAFRELTQQLLAEPETELARLRQAILEAVGGNGRVLTDHIPDLALVIGPQEPVPALDATAGENRHRLSFQSFVRAVTAHRPPLVIFLDDLQWADPASLKLLGHFLTDVGTNHLLVIGAYREHEVDAGHLLSLTLDDWRKRGAVLQSITLNALEENDVAQLIADTLGKEASEIQALAQVMNKMTGGNPFFLGQLLKSFYAEGLLVFDREVGGFRFDLEGIRAAHVAENVVEFMSAKITKLDPETQHILMIAACVGHRFTAKVLSVVLSTSQAEVGRRLWSALREGLVLPLDPSYRFLLEGAAEDLISAGLDVFFRFLHDRVQQAAYSLLDENARRNAHLQIGRLLLREHPDEVPPERLFEILDHLQVGAALLTDADERHAIAKLFLRAGKLSRSSTAYESAAKYCKAGIELLGAGGFDESYELAYALSLEQAECEFMSNCYEVANSIFAKLLEKSTSALEKARIESSRLVLCSYSADYVGAFAAARNGLALMGIKMPEGQDALLAAFEQTHEKIQNRLAGRPVTDLAALPIETSPEAKAIRAILVAASPTAYSTNALLLGWLAASQVYLSLEYGNGELSPYGYVVYGLVLHGLLGRNAEAYEFGRFGLDLFAKIGLQAHVAKLNFLHGAFVQHARMPLRTCMPYLDRAREAGIQYGDLGFAVFSCYHQSMIRLRGGDELGELRTQVEQFLALARRFRHELIFSMLVTTRQVIAALMGETESLTSLSDERFDESSFAETLQASHLQFPLQFYTASKQELCFLSGDYAESLQWSRKLEAQGKRGLAAHFVTDIPFYSGLVLAAMYADSSDEEKPRNAEQMAQHLAAVASLAERCPVNHQHKYLLLTAELARIGNRPGEAWEHYELAIEAARDNGFPHHEAIANELFAKFYLRRGNRRAAGIHLRNAYQGYLRWGAAAKAKLMLVEHPQLLGKEARIDARVPATHDTFGTTTESAVGIDVAAILLASQAMAAEIDLEKLLDRLLRIMVESAGADHCVLLLVRDDQLEVNAVRTLQSASFPLHERTKLDDFSDIASSVVRFVERTREPVVLGDAAGAHAFSADPYLASRPPKSLLCVAMVQESRLRGILYLENRATKEAFPRNRVELARVLASHAAIAIENALLVEGIRRRTEALAELNQTLTSSNEKLSRELFERKQAEAARAALTAELMRVQTPLIPLTHKIALMPLIGSIDATRAEQIMQVALEGAHTSHAKVVLIDVTGVERVDASVAQMLSETSRALGLLGVCVVITGIRSDMARAFVAGGLEFSTIVTRGTLEQGLNYAFARLRSMS